MVQRLLPTLARLCREAKGSMVIETAIVTPVLVMMALGGFEASRIVARQTELQSAAAEAAAIVRAAIPDTAAKRTTIRNVIAASTGIDANNITVTEVFRCGNATAYVSDDSTCANPDTVTNYVRVSMSTSYTPEWTNYGIGSTINYNVQRTVLIG